MIVFYYIFVFQIPMIDNISLLFKGNKHSNKTRGYGFQNIIELVNCIAAPSLATAEMIQRKGEEMLPKIFKMFLQAANR